MQNNEGIEFYIGANATFVMKLDGFQDLIQALDVHIGGVNEFVEFYILEPYFLLEDGLGRDGEAIAADEVGFAFVAKIWIILQK